MRFIKPPTMLPLAIPTKSPFSDIGPRVLNHAQFKKDAPDLTKWPQHPSEIRGIDATALMWLRQKPVYALVPTVVRNRWFLLYFYPASHAISKYRKSLVALTFTMIPMARFDDPDLEKQYNQYKGKFCNDVYFKSSLRPCDTAWGRTTFKKLSRDAMFKAMLTLSEREQLLVSGVWRMHYYAHPVGDAARRLFFDEWQLAMAKAVLTKFQQKLITSKPVTRPPPRVSPLDSKVPHLIRLPFYIGPPKTKSNGKITQPKKRKNKKT